MTTIDLVFEGGGAKGMVFIGALEVLFDEAAHSHGRLLGTSAGAITAMALAAGYTVPELKAALTENDKQGKPIFTTFLGVPPALNTDEIRHSAIRMLLAQWNIRIVPDFIEKYLDNFIAKRLAQSELGQHLFSLTERGALYDADPFVKWAIRKLNEGEFNGQQRQFGDLTLKEFYDQTEVELTLVAADTTWARPLWLNHRTAPDCPVVWAARMSMSVPLLWPEVEWQEGWGPYHTWDSNTNRLEPQDLTGHMIVDGGLLSNFPISLFVADGPDVSAVVGKAHTENVLGLLLDETRPVPNLPPRPTSSLAAFRDLRAVQQLMRLVNTATGAHDNMAKALYKANVVRLPAGGFNTTWFDITDVEREALVSAGRDAMRAFLASRVPVPAVPVPAVPVPPGLVPAAPVPPAFPAVPGFAVSSELRRLANKAASGILGD